ncbi:MAG TPA: hypothetical protein VF137_01430 [Candidatus Dormibacteraeota bacterium]
MGVEGMCTACHARPATRLFTAPFKELGQVVDEAAVCAECYSVLVLVLKRDEVDAANRELGYRKAR